jgi:NADPH:quinone reductase-like Zn-dependent oxidoreductase
VAKRLDKHQFAKPQPHVRAARLTGGAKAHVVYDGVGRETFDASLASLRPRGMMVSIGPPPVFCRPFQWLRLIRSPSS